jgi:hypothetical protein
MCGFLMPIIRKILKRPLTAWRGTCAPEASTET